MEDETPDVVSVSDWGDGDENAGGNSDDDGWESDGAYEVSCGPQVASQSEVGSSFASHSEPVGSALQPHPGLQNLPASTRRQLDSVRGEMQRRVFEANVRRLQADLAARTVELRSSISPEEHKCAGECAECVAATLLSLWQSDPVAFVRRVKGDADAEIWARHVGEQFDAEVAQAVAVDVPRAVAPAPQEVPKKPVAPGVTLHVGGGATTIQLRKRGSLPAGEDPDIKRTLAALRAVFSEDFTFERLIHTLAQQLSNRPTYICVRRYLFIDPRPPGSGWMQLPAEQTPRWSLAGLDGDGEKRAALLCSAIECAQNQGRKCLLENATLRRLLETSPDDAGRLHFIKALREWGNRGYLAINLALRTPDEFTFFATIDKASFRTLALLALLD